MYIFATPFIIDERLHVRRNRMHMTVLGRILVDQPVPISEKGDINLAFSDINLGFTVWTQTGSLFRWGFSIPVGPISVGFSIGASWRARLNFEFDLRLSELAVESALVPSAAIDIDGRGYVQFLILRGGIGVTATVLNTVIVPQVSVALIPSISRPPGIAFEMHLLVVPLAVRIYAYVEILICIKWCKVWFFKVPCGLNWCTLLKITLAQWAMGSRRIQGPKKHFGIFSSRPPEPGSVVASQISSSTVAVEWNGFRDYDTKILQYYVCIGSHPDLSDLMSCTDVGLATSFQRSGLQISHGRRIYVTIRSATFCTVHLCY